MKKWNLRLYGYVMSIPFLILWLINKLDFLIIIFATLFTLATLFPDLFYPVKTFIESVFKFVIKIVTLIILTIVYFILLVPLSIIRPKKIKDIYPLIKNRSLEPKHIRYCDEDLSIRDFIQPF